MKAIVIIPLCYIHLYYKVRDYRRLYERGQAAVIFSSLRRRSCIKCVTWCLFVFIAVMLYVYVRFSFSHHSCSQFLTSISQLSSPSLLSSPPQTTYDFEFVYLLRIENDQALYRFTPEPCVHSEQVSASSCVPSSSDTMGRMTHIHAAYHSAQ